MRYKVVLFLMNTFDHSKAAVDLMKAGIDIYLSQGTLDALGLNGHRVHIIKAKKQFNIGVSWTVLPFKVQHNANEPLGFLLASGESKILYATDTSYLKYRFNNLTYIMLEANYSEKLLKENKSLASVVKQQITRNHMSLETAMDFLKANDLSRVQSIHLLHLSDANSDTALFKYEIQALTGKEVYVSPKGVDEEGNE